MRIFGRIRLFGAFLGLGAQATAPGLNGAASATLAFGNDRGFVQLEAIGSATAGNYGLGLSAGRGLFLGIVFGDLSDYSEGVSVALDTPFGGVAALYDNNGELAGLQVSGPSAGLSISGNGPGISELNHGDSFTLWSSSMFEDIAERIRMMLQHRSPGGCIK